MSLYNVINRALIQSGQPEDVSQIVANLDAIATVLSQIDPVNLRGAPGLVAGEAPVWNGANWDRSSVTRIEPTSLKPSAYVTTLPGSPYDGQEVVLVDSTTLGTFYWRFRYNLGSSRTDKWEFIGGVPAAGGMGGSISTSSTSYVDLTGGPTIVVPRAGLYQIETSVFGQNTVFTAPYNLTAQIVGSSSGVLFGFDVFAATATFAGGRGGALQASATLAAGETLKIQVRGNNPHTSTFNNGALALLPIRVS